ncbi:hypothetical protein [Vibrio sp. F74]|uniref:hypothetical protein n=1 Tax=Vibrio sp. F74 TaxID=700020 RepID=UPI0035F561E9
MPEIDISEEVKQERKILNLREFRFIDKKDPISISFAYLFVHIRNFSESGNVVSRKNKRLVNKQRLMDIVPDYDAYDSSDMLSIFIEFCINMNSDYSIRGNFVNETSYLYRKYKYENKLSWLDKNNREQGLWLKNYIKQNITLKKAPSILNIEELIHITAPALIYVLDITDAERELLIIKMRQAWGQVKYRNKIRKEKKVSFNLVVDESTKKNLKKLAQDSGRTMNETIEILINAAAEANRSKS